MPVLQRVQALTANQRGYNPLSGWQYEYAPYRALVRVGMNATTANVQAAAFTGSTNVVERGPVTSGATAGVMPAPLNIPYWEFIVEGGDRIQILVDETGGAAATVNTFVAIDPAP